MSSQSCLSGPGCSHRSSHLQSGRYCLLWGEGGDETKRVRLLGSPDPALPSQAHPEAGPMHPDSGPRISGLEKRDNWAPDKFVPRTEPLNLCVPKTLCHLVKAKDSISE